MDKTTYFYPNKTLRIGDSLLDLSTPIVMGILNVTPDSFFDGGSYSDVDTALKHTGRLISEGADIIDVGGMSTRPGAKKITAEEEILRVIPIIKAIRKEFGTVPISIDTVYGKVAKESINAGANLINDVSAGNYDPEIFKIAAETKVPYVLMHMQGTPETMQVEPQYSDVTREVFDFFIKNIHSLKGRGIEEIIIDPGFGFGKTTEHNYLLAKNLDVIKQIGLPVMVGISRKSMICKVLKVNPEKALTGSTALHAILLLKGADILRVHDIKEAKEVIKIVSQLKI